MGDRTKVDRAAALLGRSVEGDGRQRQRAEPPPLNPTPPPGRHKGGRSVKLTAAELAPFVVWLEQPRTIASTAERFDVCRATIYKWIKVLEAAGYSIPHDEGRPRLYRLEDGPAQLIEN